MALRYTTTIIIQKNKKKCLYPDDFGVRGLVIRKPFQTKIDTSIVVRVSYIVKE